MKVIEKNIIQCGAKDVHPGCIIKYDDDFYIVIDRNCFCFDKKVGDDFIEVVKLTDGKYNSIRHDVIVVDGKFVVN